MLILYWNGNVFNERFVFYPRTGVLHAFLLPRRQNLTTFASGEKWFLFRIRFKNYKSGLTYGRLTGLITSPDLDIDVRVKS